MKISNYFDSTEVEHSDTAIKLKIDNEVPSELLENAKALAVNCLDAIRERYGKFSPESWYRCVKLNDAEKGVKNSQHLLAKAADIKIPGVTTQELAIWCSENLKFDQLIMEEYHPGDKYSGWVHISWDGEHNRNNKLAFNGLHYYIVSDFRSAS